MLDHSKPDWWKEAVFYQIYPKSFQDSNNDGIGDIPGITSRLDYLSNLGVDGIWLSPVFLSPQRDNGYDVADYRAIDPMFGTMEAFEKLIREAKKRGIILIMDFVFNHTSSDHPWFLNAKSSRDSEYHDSYIWRDGPPDTPPDKTCAVFGGPAWTYVPEIGQWYFHNFAPFQPDLNWQNPKVRKALADTVRFWLEKGVGGIRLDAIGYAGKDLEKGIRTEGPALHPYLREMRREAFPDPAVVAIGEALETKLENAFPYVNPDGSELSMIFQGYEFELDGEEDWADAKWNWTPPALPEWKKHWERWQHGMYKRGWNTLVLDNHDNPRAIGIWGDEGEYRSESAKMLAVCQFCQQGTPFVYQGDELGMTNPALELDQFTDVESKNYIARAKASGKSEEEILASVRMGSRDNSRTPMQWSQSVNGGFTAAEPWIAANPNYTVINAEQQVGDPNSVYSFYRDLFAMRRKYPVFRDGTFTLLDPDDAGAFCYMRDTDSEHVLVQCSFSRNPHPAPIPDAFRDAEILLSNYPDSDPSTDLRPFEARILYTGSR